MSQLVPCPACQRHVRLTESSCPFCSAALSSAVMGAAHASRQRPVQRGLKRAALFAIGAGVVAAAPGCGGRSDDGSGESTETVQPVYGAPISTSTTSGTTSTPTGSTPPATTDTDASNSGSVPTAQPVYGAPIPSATNTATTDSNGRDTTGTRTNTATTTSPTAIQPPYGAPVIIETTTDPRTTTTVPARDASADTPADGGVEAGVEAEAGADAGVVSAPIEPDPDAGLQIQPLYGAIAPQ